MPNSLKVAFGNFPRRYYPDRVRGYLSAPPIGAPLFQVQSYSIIPWTSWQLRLFPVNESQGKPPMCLSADLHG